jgi:hypothetical protein
VAHAGPFQVGALVDDVDEGRRLYGAVGLGGWLDSGWVGQVAYVDVAAGRVVEPRVRMVLGRISPQLCVELIQVDASHDVPTAWNAQAAPATSHLAYWSHDVAADVERLRSAGATLVMARVAGPDAQRDQAALLDGQLPSSLAIAYLADGSGPMIELVSTSLWSGPLEGRFGPLVRHVVPPPTL